jgi:hypothetical protein
MGDVDIPHSTDDRGHIPHPMSHLTSRPHPSFLIQPIRRNTCDPTELLRTRPQGTTTKRRMVRSGYHDDLVRSHALRSDEPFLLHPRDPSSLADGVVPQASVLTKNSAGWGNQVTRSGFWGGVLACSITRDTSGQLDSVLCNALQAEEGPTDKFPKFAPLLPDETHSHRLFTLSCGQSKLFGQLSHLGRFCQVGEGEQGL